MDGSVGESGQDGGEVLTHRDLESAAGFDDGEDCCDAWSSLLVSDVGPVATANRHRAHGVLREVVAQLQFWIVEEASELVPHPRRHSDMEARRSHPPLRLAAHRPRRPHHRPRMDKFTRQVLARPACSA